MKRFFSFALSLLIIGLMMGYYYGFTPRRLIDFFSSDKSGFSNLKDSLDNSIKDNINKTSPKIKSKIHTPVEPSQKSTSEEAEFQPLPVNQFASLDKYARDCPSTAEKSIELLANYLQKNTRTDLEKARTIFIWITKNISYDFVAFNSGINGDCSAEGVLKSRKSVCEGFSNLYLALGKQMNLEIQKVSGYAKGYGFEGTFTKPNHAWNLIKIEGQWNVFDATWGEGYGKNVNGKLVSTKEFNEYWFNVNPFAAIFSHLPENKALQNIRPELDLHAFEKFPKTDEYYFQLGFDPATTFNNVYRNRTLTFPNCYKVGTYVLAQAAPTFGILNAKGSYNFEFYAPRGISFAIIDAKNKWTYFKNNKGVFSLSYTPAIAGKIKICMTYEKGGDAYTTIMEYAVK